MCENKTVLKLLVKKPMIEEYLRFIYGTKKGPVKIDRHGEVGKFIYSMVKYVELPAKKMEISEGDITIDIILPDYRLSSAERKHCYWNCEDMDRINDFVMVDFNIFFRGYMLAGKEMGVQQKDLIEAFMAYTGIKEVGKKFDTLKKKDYRHRQKIAEILNNSLEKIGFQTHTKKISDLSL